MAKYEYKAINFDLDVNLLKEHYSQPTGKPFTSAYHEIRSFFEKNGFEHRQGSGYVSKEKLTRYEITQFTQEISEKFSWLHKCVKEFDVTDVKNQYSLLNDIREFAQNNDNGEVILADDYVLDITEDDDILDLTEEEGRGR